MIVCVAGNPSIDKLFEVDRLAHGDIHRPQHFVALPGGKGIHVAQVATALGSQAIATGILAGHAGRWLHDELAAEGVSARFAWSAGETRSSLSVADHETGRLTEFYESGTPVSAETWRELEEIVAGLLEGASWLALAGSLPPGAPADGYGRLISTARRAGVATALDTRGDALARSIDAHPDLVKINAHEAGQLLDRSISSIDDAHDAAVAIHRRAGDSARCGHHDGRAGHRRHRSRRNRTPCADRGARSVSRRQRRRVARGAAGCPRPR